MARRHHQTGGGRTHQLQQRGPQRARRHLGSDLCRRRAADGRGMRQARRLPAGRCQGDAWLPAAGEARDPRRATRVDRRRRGRRGARGAVHQIARRGPPTHLRDGGVRATQDEGRAARAGGPPGHLCDAQAPRVSRGQGDTAAGHHDAAGGRVRQHDLRQPAAALLPALRRRGARGGTAARSPQPEPQCRCRHWRGSRRAERPHGRRAGARLSVPTERRARRSHTAAARQRRRGWRAGERGGGARGGARRRRGRRRAPLRLSLRRLPPARGTGRPVRPRGAAALLPRGRRRARPRGLPLLGRPPAVAPDRSRARAHAHHAHARPVRAQRVHPHLRAHDARPGERALLRVAAQGVRPLRRAAQG